MILNKAKTDNIPYGWISTKIGEILEFNYGKGLPKTKRDPSGKIPVYGSNGIVGYHTQALINNSAIIVGRKGTVGKAHLSETPFWPIDTTYYVIPPTGLDIKFVNYLLNSLNLGSLDKSTAIPGLNRDDAYNVSIYIPPSLEQHRIVSKIEELFTKLDVGVEALKKAKAQLNQYRQSVLKSAFEGKLTEGWRSHRDKIGSAKKILDQINKEKEGQYNLKKQKTKSSKKKKDRQLAFYKPVIESDQQIIPVGWEWTELDNISSKITDGTHFTPKYTPEGIKFISVKDIYDDEIHFDNCKYISKEEHKKLIERCHPEINDVLITKSGTIGRTAVVKDNIDFSLFVSVALIKLFNQYVNPHYIKFALQNYINQIDIQQTIKGGVIKNLHIEDLRKIIIPLTSQKEQKQIVDAIDKQMSFADSVGKIIDQNIIKIQTLRTSILTKAFQGKLVPQDPTDEPTSQLLEQIKAGKEASQKNQKKTSKRAGKTRKKTRK